MSRAVLSVSHPRLIYNASKEVAVWAGHKLGTDFRSPFFALGILDKHGHLVGAVIYNDFEFSNVEMTIIWPEGFGFRHVAKEVFAYAFDHLNCRRISLTIPEKHTETIRHAQKWGWQIEGIKRDYYSDDHAVILGLLKADCRILRSRVIHGDGGGKAK